MLIADHEDLADAREVALQSEAGGYWSGYVPETRVGMHHRYRLDSGDFPDTASRFQPQGPHGSSLIREDLEKHRP